MYDVQDIIDKISFLKKLRSFDWHFVNKRMIIILKICVLEMFFKKVFKLSSSHVYPSSPPNVIFVFLRVNVGPSMVIALFCNFCSIIFCHFSMFCIVIMSSLQMKGVILFQQFFFFSYNFVQGINLSFDIDLSYLVGVLN